ncbi:MAG TPA: VWA domain-containing protein [Candidatus Hydrogenedentes bacterium]|nr:VWA domain-containing protein [Candidatus Hydrogenedentota bacterium]
MILSRHMVFALSVVLSLALHGAFLVFAPRIEIFQRNVNQSILEYYSVRLTEDGAIMAANEETRRTESGKEGDSQGLVSRPGKVQDLIARGKEETNTGSSPQNTPTEVSHLTERVASDTIHREHDLQPDELAMKSVDAKILEISQETARKEVQVARRLVRPSPSRILEDGEYPTLRTPRNSEEDKPLRLEIQPSPFTAQDQIVKQTETPPSPETLAPPPPAPDQVMPRNALAQETQQARTENPHSLLDNLVDIKLTAYVPEKNSHGYFQLKIAPKENESIEILPKDVTFIIDASGSITQSKLNVTRRGVQAAVTLLHPEDRFNIIVFREAPIPFKPELAPATEETKTAAIAFLENLQAKGETDVYNAINPVISGSPRPGIPSLLVVISDGRATVGIRDARAIINGITAENNLRNSIFAYGGGETVNRYLMDLLAYRNKGESHVTAKIADIEKDLPAFFQNISDPLLVNIKTDYASIEENSVFPEIVPDFYKGRIVTVYGRFDPAKDSEFVMRLAGAAQDRSKELVFRANLRKAATGKQAIAKQWAFQKAYAIIGQISRDGERPELMNQLKELKQKYGVSTSYDQ